MIHIYTGNGKGKTTAALGLALRVVGAGKKVLLIQFLKNGQSSEIKAIKKLPNFEIKSFGQKGFVKKNKLTRKDFDLAQQGFDFFEKALKSNRYNLIILDEINLAVKMGLIKENDLAGLIRRARRMFAKAELVLTGRQASKKIIQLSDLTTEMKEIKHYFRKGVKARKGIEY
jgi:cob(I)alamin adenosyltransferase